MDFIYDVAAYAPPSTPALVSQEVPTSIETDIVPTLQ